MSEWLIYCTDNLKSGTYYANVDICDGEQPVMILFRKNGEKNFIVGQGKTVNSQGYSDGADKMKMCLKRYNK